MSGVDQFFLARSIEHVMVALIGAAVVWMGYRLFREMPLRREGELKIALPGGISIYLSRVGPGIFFALFGTGLIGYTATRPVSFQQGGGNVTLSGFGENSAPTQDVATTHTAQPRPEVVRTLAEMADENDTVPISDRQIRRTTALRLARQQIMVADWDPNWGSTQEFRRWVDSGMPNPPPAAVARAVQAFRGQ